jgi:uncharacterized protein YyaL (SSP411 family)
MINRLSKESSPYLFQHSTNPVHWQPWDDHAFKEAQKSNKPVLLSIGYSACHWCHVMEQESFSDPSIAALMNDLCINIKVDREERPDIDKIYQSALESMGLQRGWPLTMFLTPAGEPFGGGTYFPKNERFGYPSFPDVIRSHAELFSRNPQKAHENARKTLDQLTQKTYRLGDSGFSSEFLNYSATQILDQMDIVYGGFGINEKFPQVPFLEHLWQAYVRTGSLVFRESVVRTLKHMCLGGIYDHLGGGFSRYTIDDRWLVPHFEKMLYDNALIVSFLLVVWRETKDPLFFNTITETVNWLIREMHQHKAGFCSSCSSVNDADGDGCLQEGAFYIWSEYEIDQILGDDSALFKKYYDVSDQGNWDDGKNILNRTDHPLTMDSSLEDNLKKCRKILFDVRSKRIHPDIDDKILIDWNGLAIAAVAEAGATFGQEDWIISAADAYSFIKSEMFTGTVLHHSYRSGIKTDLELLDDYANLSYAGLTLHTITGDATYLKDVKSWVARLKEHYWDVEEGGFFLTPDNQRSLIIRSKSAAESAVPSGNAMMLKVLCQLFSLTGDSLYRDDAKSVLSAFSVEAESKFLSMVSLLNYSQWLSDFPQIIIAISPGDANTKVLINKVYSAAINPCHIINIRLVDSCIKGHPAYGKYPINNKTTVFICDKHTCQNPINEINELESSLESM